MEKPEFIPDGNADSLEGDVIRQGLQAKKRTGSMHMFIENRVLVFTPSFQQEIITSDQWRRWRSCIAQRPDNMRWRSE